MIHPKHRRGRRLRTRCPGPLDETGRCTRCDYGNKAQVHDPNRKTK